MDQRELHTYDYFLQRLYFRGRYTSIVIGVITQIRLTFFFYPPMYSEFEKFLFSSEHIFMACACKVYGHTDDYCCYVPNG